jgi:hypothetical protein
MSLPVSVTLHDIVHTEKSLTLVFEYLEKEGCNKFLYLDSYFQKALKSFIFIAPYFYTLLTAPYLNYFQMMIATVERLD